SLDQVEQIIADDRWSTGEHAEEHTAERIDVRASVQRSRLALLRAHVSRRSQYLPLQRQAFHRFVIRVKAFGYAEIHNFDEIVEAVQIAQHDVAGLEVAMDEPVFVSVSQCQAKL